MRRRVYVARVLSNDWTSNVGETQRERWGWRGRGRERGEERERERGSCLALKLCSMTALMILRPRHHHPITTNTHMAPSPRLFLRIEHTVLCQCFLRRQSPRLKQVMAARKDRHGQRCAPCSCLSSPYTPKYFTSTHS